MLGDTTVYGLLPNGNGTLNQYTQSWAAWPSDTSVGKQIKDSNGNIQQCVTGGTTAGSAPTWATTGGAFTTESTGVKWVVVGTGSNPGAANWMALSEPAYDGDSCRSEAGDGPKEFSCLCCGNRR